MKKNILFLFLLFVFVISNSYFVSSELVWYSTLEKLYYYDVSSNTTTNFKNFSYQLNDYVIASNNSKIIYAVMSGGNVSATCDYGLTWSNSNAISNDGYDTLRVETDERGDTGYIIAYKKIAPKDYRIYLTDCEFATGFFNKTMFTSIYQPSDYEISIDGNYQNFCTATKCYQSINYGYNWINSSNISSRTCVSPTGKYQYLYYNTAIYQSSNYGYSFDRILNRGTFSTLSEDEYCDDFGNYGIIIYYSSTKTLISNLGNISNINVTNLVSNKNNFNTTYGNYALTSSIGWSNKIAKINNLTGQTVLLATLPSIPTQNYKISNITYQAITSNITFYNYLDYCYNNGINNAVCHSYNITSDICDYETECEYSCSDTSEYYSLYGGTPLNYNYTGYCDNYDSVNSFKINDSYFSKTQCIKSSNTDYLCNETIYNSENNGFYCDLDNIKYCNGNCYTRIVNINTSYEWVLNNIKTCDTIYKEEFNSFKWNCSNFILSSPLVLLVSDECLVQTYDLIPTAKCSDTDIWDIVFNISNSYYTEGQCIENVCKNQCSVINEYSCYDTSWQQKCLNVSGCLLLNKTIDCSKNNDICLNGNCLNSALAKNPIEGDLLKNIPMSWRYWILIVLVFIALIVPMIFAGQAGVLAGLAFSGVLSIALTIVFSLNILIPIVYCLLAGAIFAILMKNIFVN